jgi:tripartite-type tricarboxylate transporter receptor subunit TctC
LISALGVAAAVLAGTASTAAAQNYPTKPVRIVVGFAPGGGTDIVARIAGEKLSALWGQPVIVENRAGGGGNVASELVAKAAPDGYTLLAATTNTHTINPHLYPNLSFDTLKDFAPITSVADTPMVLVVHPSVPAKSAAEFVALARSKPGVFNVGSAGTGSAGHLATEMFKITAGADVVHVSYRGAGPAVVDLLGGQIPVMFAPLAPVMPHMQAGRLNVLAVTTAQRFRLVPEVPTLQEAGVKDFEASTWFGLFAPAGTPAEIVNKIHADTAAQLADPATRKRLEDQALNPVGNSPAEFAAQLKAENDRFAKIISAAGIKIE